MIDFNQERKCKKTTKEKYLLSVTRVKRKRTPFRFYFLFLLLFQAQRGTFFFLVNDKVNDKHYVRGRVKEL